MWFFLCPRIVFGEDALQELTQLSGNRAFIVTDATLEKLGLVQKVTEPLSLAGIESIWFSDVEPDPSLQTVERCAAEIQRYAPDWIIGFGGGSCLDAAKAAWFLYERPDIPLDAINPFETFGLRKKARFAAISTTSGTGADVSWGFALYDAGSQSKLVRVSRELIPDLAIVDPSLVNTMPAQIIADSGMDVLAHAIEAYTNIWANDFSDAMALKAIQLAFDYLPQSYHSTADQVAREHMHNAATMAGLAFSNTAIILAHALAHAAGALFHTPHGRTVGLLLPYTIEYNGRTSPQRYIEIASMLGFASRDDPNGVDLLVTEIRRLAREIQQPLSLLELGVTREELTANMPALVNNTLSALELIANPRSPDEDEVKRIFEYAFRGQQIDF